jgi:hypothetical protein
MELWHFQAYELILNALGTMRSVSVYLHNNLLSNEG